MCKVLINPRSGGIDHHWAWIFAQHIIRGDSQGTFLAKRLAVFGNQRKSIRIRVDSKTQVGSFCFNRIAKLRQILGQRFGISGKQTRRLAVNLNGPTAKLIQKVGDKCGPRAADTIQDDLEFARANLFDINIAKF